MTRNVVTAVAATALVVMGAGAVIISRHMLQQQQPAIIRLEMAGRAPMQPWSIRDLWMENRAQQKTVEGQLIDMTCYVEHAGFGDAHRACALACAKSGMPMGLVDKHGALYLISGAGHVPLAEVNKALLSHLESTVTITGYFFEQHDVKLGAAERIEKASQQLTDADVQELYDGRKDRAAGDGAALIAAAAQAMGGAPALTGIEDIVLETSIVLSSGQGDHRGDAKTRIVYPNKIRTDLSLPVAGNMVQGYDGSSAWLQGDSQVVDLPPTMADEMARLALVSAGLGLVREVLEGRADVRALDVAPRGNRTGKVVEWRRNADRAILTIDANTHFLSSVVYRSVSPQEGTADVEVVLSDYRSVDGVTIPWRTTVYRNERQYSDSTLKRARFNTGIASSAFDKPTTPVSSVR